MATKRDSYTQQLQMLLDELGFNPGAADGIWGPNTRKAVGQALGALKGFMEKQDLAATETTPQPVADELRTKLTAQLRRDEGETLYAYQDNLGYWTIGIGRLIDRRRGGGISGAESEYLFNNDCNRVVKTLYAALPWVEKLDAARQGALLNMCFQMGLGDTEGGTGLLGFRNTLELIRAGRYDDASRNVLQSLYARQTPNRAKRIAKQIATGVWQ